MRIGEPLLGIGQVRQRGGEGGVGLAADPDIGPDLVGGTRQCANPLMIEAAPLTID
jgi:hypothetical protein